MRVSSSSWLVEFQRESCDEVKEEIFPLIEAHFKEVRFHDAQELKPDFSRYYMLETMGALRIFTARKASRLLGYAFFFIERHHHFGYQRASQDLLYLTPEARGNGMRFISYCDEQLKEDSVEYVSHSVTAKKDFSRLLERLGYQMQETIYTRKLS